MTAPAPTPFDLLGGDAGVRRLVDRFYDLIDSAPEAATIRALHATSLKASRDKLYLYLTYWTGGPQTCMKSAPRGVSTIAETSACPVRTESAEPAPMPRR